MTGRGKWMTALGVMAALCFGLAIAVWIFLSGGRLTALVVRPLERALGQPIAYEGSRIGLFGAHFTGLSLGPGPAPFLRVRTLRAGWDLWALLHGELRVKSLNLEHPALSLARDEAGRIGLAVPVGGPRAAPAPPSAAGPPAPKPNGAQGPGRRLLIELVTVTDGTLVIEDRAARPPRVRAISGLNGRLAGWGSGSPPRFTISGPLLSELPGRFTLKGSGDLTARTAEAVLSAEARLPSPTPGRTDQAGLSGSLLLSSSLALLPGGRVTAQGELRGSALTLRHDSLQLPLPLGDLKAVFNIEADTVRGDATLRSLDLTGAGQDLQGEGTWSPRAVPPTLSFSLRGKTVRAETLAAIIGASVGPTSGETPKASSAAGTTDKPLLVTGKINVQELLLPALPLQAVAARLTYSAGKLRVEPFDARLHEGAVRGTFALDTGRKPSAWDGDATTRGMRLEKLVAGLAPTWRGALTGTLEGHAGVRGAGADLATLSGELSAQAVDGRISGLPILKELANLFSSPEMENLAYRSLRLESTMAPGTARVTTLALDSSTLRASGSGTVGLPGWRLDLALAVEVPRELASRLVRDKAVLQALGGTGGWSRVPLRLTGTIEKPKVVLDTAGLAEQVSRNLGGVVKGKDIEKGLGLLKKLFGR